MAHQQPSVNGVRNSKTAASNLNAVNLTSSNLPVNLSGLTLPLLPRGVAATNNLASLLASGELFLFFMIYRCTYCLMMDDFILLHILLLFKKEAT